MRNRGTKKMAKRAIRKIKKRSTVKLVKRVVRSMAETKQARFLYNGGQFNLCNVANSSGFASVGVQQLTPNATYTIAQGSGQADRLGNRIRVVGARLKFSIFPNVYDATTNPIPTPQVVMMWFCKSKDVASRDTANTATNCTSVFFNTGNSSEGLGGTMFDFCKPLNHDTFTHYGRRVFKIGAANYQTNTGTQANAYSYSNNEFKLNCIASINLMKHGYPRVIDWNDTTALPKTNPLYVVMSPCDATGTAAGGGASAVPLKMEMVLELDYKDE